MLISQDRHELYITCATYTTGYIRYLRKQLGHLPAEDIILTMNEFGPFVLHKESHVRDLGSVLLSLTLKWGK